MVCGVCNGIMNECSLRCSGQRNGSPLDVAVPVTPAVQKHARGSRPNKR